jgi:hypothetical protein
MCAGDGDAKQLPSKDIASAVAPANVRILGRRYATIGALRLGRPCIHQWAATRLVCDAALQC